MYKGEEVQLHVFLTSGLIEVVSFTLWPLYFQEKTPLG
jgi:hypothetical protein